MSITEHPDNWHPDDWILTTTGLMGVIAFLLVVAVAAWTITQWVGDDPEDDSGDDTEGGTDGGDTCAVVGCTRKGSQPVMRHDNTLIVVCRRCEEELTDPRPRR